MRNSYKYKPSFYRRHWFIASVVLLCLVAAVAGGLAYAYHLHLTAKAAELDLSALDKMENASTIFDRTGATFGYIYEEKRERIPLADMAIDLQHAVVSAEDNRFYTHSGSDPRGILRAAFQNLRGSRIRKAAARSPSSWRATRSRSAAGRSRARSWRSTSRTASRRR